MKPISAHLRLALCLALLAGCSNSPSETGSAQFAVFLPRSGADSLARASVTVSDADMLPATVELASTQGTLSGSLSNLPAGAQRSFLAQAFDTSGRLLFQGSATGVPISAGQASLVAMSLQAPNAAPASLDEAPVIDSLVASSTSVLTGGTLSLRASAHGLHPDEPLSYDWSSTAGSFSPASGGSTTWTAPASPGPQTLTVTVTDSGGLSSSASVDITVSGKGAAQFAVSLNSTPAVNSLSATPSPLAVGQASDVSVSASDEDGDNLSYSWSASCPGTWAQANSASAQFTPSAAPSSSCDPCALTVTVADGRGGQNTGSMALCVSATPAPPRFNPLILRSYSSVAPWDSIPAEGLIYEVAASDPQGAALNFSWAANTGALGPAANSTSTSRITWTPPACVNRGTTATITATVTNAFNLTATHSFTALQLPNCSVSTWSGTGAMASARYNFAATSLQDGKVLVTGGQGAPATTELYDPALGRWSTTGAMRSARYSHTATLLPDGKVLVAGGNNNSGSYLATADLYNPATGTWSAVKNSMATARYLHTATLLNNGKVLIVGGNNNGTYLGTAELYNPATGTWTSAGAMAVLRAYHTATLLNNGKVLIVGGRGTGTSSYQPTAELYDPALGTWTSTNPMATARAQHTATLLPDGKVLVVGGYNNANSYLATAEVYDPSLGTWSSAGTLSAKRGSHTATLLPTGKVLVSGGINSQNGILQTAELYDPSSRTWSTAGAMASARRDHTATLLSTGKVLVSGGLESTSLSAAELYTP